MQASMQRCSSSHSTHRRRSFHARQSKAAQLRQPVRATATSAAAGSDVELAATVGHLISWLASSGASVTNRLEPKRFKADVGERVGLIAAVDAAAGEKEVLVGGSPTWTQCTEHMAATSMPATPVEAGCEGSRQALQVLVMTVSTVYAKFSCFRNSAQPGKSMCLKVSGSHWCCGTTNCTYEHWRAASICSLQTQQGYTATSASSCVCPNQVCHSTCKSVIQPASS